MCCIRPLTLHPGHHHLYNCHDGEVLTIAISYASMYILYSLVGSTMLVWWQRRDPPKLKHRHFTRRLKPFFFFINIRGACRSRNLSAPYLISLSSFFSADSFACGWRILSARWPWTARIKGYTYGNDGQRQERWTTTDASGVYWCCVLASVQG